MSKTLIYAKITLLFVLFQVVRKYLNVAIVSGEATYFILFISIISLGILLVIYRKQRIEDFKGLIRSFSDTGIVVVSFLMLVLYINDRFKEEEYQSVEYKIYHSINHGSRRSKIKTTTFHISTEQGPKKLYVGRGYSSHKNEYKFIVAKKHIGGLRIPVLEEIEALKMSPSGD